MSLAELTGINLDSVEDIMDSGKISNRELIDAIQRTKDLAQD
jgi:hypothetical protein